MLYRLDNVTENCTCCRKLACASAVEHSLIYTVTVNEYRVEYVAYASHDILMRDKHWHYAREDTTVVKSSYRSYKLDSVSEDISSSYVSEVNFGNTLCVNVLRIYVLAENE